jgi:hypothetical protein
MTMQLLGSEKLKRAADISFALAAQITDLLELREALQTSRGAQRSKPQDAASRMKANSAPGRLFMRARW